MNAYKILIVLTPSFDPNSGGVQMTSFKMASHFANVGHTVSIFSFNNKGHIDQSFARLHHATHDQGIHDYRNLAQLEEVVNTEAPHVVINQMPYDHAIGEVLGRGKNKFNYLLLGCLRNTLYSVRYNLDAYAETVVPSTLRPFFRNALGRFVLLQQHKRRHARDLRKILDTYDYFVMFGPQNQEEIRYFIGDYKAHKLAYIPNSIPDVLPSLPPKEKVILFLGRLAVTQKRVDLLMPLWKKIAGQLPDWNFWIVGDGPEYKPLSEQIQNEKIERVKLWGKQAPYTFFEKAAIFVMTSSYEGFPNVLAEAQSRGCASVVFDSYPIVNLIIDNQKNGFIVKPFNVEEMAETIVRLAKDDHKLQQVQNQALTDASRFVIGEVGKLWNKLFDSYNNGLSK